MDIIKWVPIMSKNNTTLYLFLGLAKWFRGACWDLFTKDASRGRVEPKHVHARLTTIPS